MQKIAAQKLVKDVLQNSFQKERFIDLVKNIFNRIEETNKRPYTGSYIFDDFKDSIHSLERIGKYKDPEGKLIDILIVHLKKDTSLERARTKQRNFVAKYLKSRGDVMKDAALVAFVAPNGSDWRFSLVKMEYKFNEKRKAQEEFTPARRYSFLVGQTENSHTAQSRLLPILLEDETNPTLQKLEDAFSVEKVTKEFFEKYRNLFLQLNDSLDDIVKKDSNIKKDFNAKNINTADFAKKLLGQIIFLYFLQKKGWFGVQRGQDWGTGSKNFLRELFEKKHGDYDNFFNDILESLFYEALRLERSGDYYSKFNCRIPFLNGGLFDPLCDYDWWNTDILLPNDIFSNDRKTKQGDVGDGILDIFDRYNFTVKEDEPLEKEVAVDPEMLGKVFENLLDVEDRKSKGTYYTPREIVHYMCQESLSNYLATDLEGKMSKEDIDTLIKYGETAVENESRVISNGRETDRYSFKLPENVRVSAKTIDEKLASIRVCDPAVGSGAFPVGMMNEIVRTRLALTPHIGTNGERTPYHFKRHAIQNCLYGVDIDPGAVEIAKLRLWLSLIVDEEERKNIQPLPNLDYKIVQGNSLSSVEKNLFTAPLFNKLEELKPLYFNETSISRKQAYRKQIDELINQITNGRKDFDFEVYFSEVFHEKKGFDVVIANPPYVKEDTNRNVFDGLRNTECYQGKMDLWYLFGCKGLDFLKHRGIMCFIATNNWISNDGASKFRNKILTEGRLIDFIDFGNYKVFTAGIQTMVYVMSKDSEQSQYELHYSKLLDDNADLARVSDFLELKTEMSAPNFEKYIVDFNRQDFMDTYIKFIPPAVNIVVEKIKKVGTFHLSDDEVFSGIDVMQDFINKAGVEKLGDRFEAGAGVFVVSNKEKDGISWNKRELELIKPYYTTREINRYNVNSQNQFWVLYTGAEVNRSIVNYPNIKKHLDQFKNIITSVNKPYGLHRTRDEQIFLGEKILSVRKCSRPSFAYVDFPCYVARTFLIIKSNHINLKFLLGILNSKLIEFWLYEKGKLQGNLYQVDKIPLQSIPIKIVRQEEQNGVIEIVNKILTTTKDVYNLENPTKQTKVPDYEKQIDQLVYKLYGLTSEEIKIVENHG